MARKRLSDLLREEQKAGGNKATDSESTDSKTTDSESTDSKATDSKTTDNKATGGTSISPELPESEKITEPEKSEPAIEVVAEVLTAPADQIEPVAQLRDAGVKAQAVEEVVVEVEVQSVPPEPQANRHHSPTQADMEAMIARLKTDLDAVRQEAQTKESALQIQVDRLQGELTAHRTTIQQLQRELQREIDRSEPLKAELESAKQMILRLSQPTSPRSPEAAQSSPALAAAQPPAAQPPAASKPPARSKPAALSYIPSPRAAEPELESQPAAQMVPTKIVHPERAKPYQVALHKVLDHPTLPGSLPPMSSDIKSVDREVKLSDTDVGWMD